MTQGSGKKPAANLRPKGTVVCVEIASQLPKALRCHLYAPVKWEVQYWPTDCECCRPAGFAWVSTRACIEHIYVMPEFRRKGIAKCLLHEIERQLGPFELTMAVSHAGERLCRSWFGRMREPPRSGNS
jgi:GNAT superfamily N-acetyltransferase